MDDMPHWLSSLMSIAGLIGSLATAIATVFLWRVTKSLARETTRMAEASAQPHVVATLSPNIWSMNHFDLHVDNTGNATAYEIAVSFDPPLASGEGRTEREVPLQKISVLKPGQGIASYLSEYGPLVGQKYQVTVSWRNTQKNEREENVYTLNMADNDGISRLGDDPLVQIANHVKKLQEAWAPVARGSKRIKIDLYSSEDRSEEVRVRREQFEQMREKQKHQLESKEDYGGAADVVEPS